MEKVKKMPDISNTTLHSRHDLTMTELRWSGEDMKYDALRGLVVGQYLPFELLTQG